MLSGMRLPSSVRKAAVMKVRGFRGERWWVWVAMAVLASGIVILNILTAVLNHIMPRKAPFPKPDICSTVCSKSSHQEIAPTPFCNLEVGQTLHSGIGCSAIKGLASRAISSAT